MSGTSITVPSTAIILSPPKKASGVKSVANGLATISNKRVITDAPVRCRASVIDEEVGVLKRINSGIRKQAREEFRKFVEVNGDKTQAEMVKLWSGEISERTISRGLKKIGFTRKKNLWLSRKR